MVSSLFRAGAGAVTAVTGLAKCLPSYTQLSNDLKNYEKEKREEQARVHDMTPDEIELHITSLEMHLDKATEQLSAFESAKISSLCTNILKNIIGCYKERIAFWKSKL